MGDSWMFIILLLWLVGISMALISRSTTAKRIEYKLDVPLKVDISFGPSWLTNNK